MIRGISPWLRALAVALALTLAAETTGATAALVVMATCSDCCGHGPMKDDCAAQSCTVMCGVTCCTAMQESAIWVDGAAPCARWATVEQSGVVRPAKPPVPPPRA